MSSVRRRSRVSATTPLPTYRISREVALPYLLPLAASLALTGILWWLSFRSPTAFPLLVLGPFVLLLPLYFYSWLNALYAGVSPQLPLPPPAPSLLPTAALLLLIKDELDERAVESMVRLQYPRDRLRLVLCDDSVRPGVREQVDSLAAQYGLEVIRRPLKRGLKAGNLNYCITQVDSELLGILDYDSEVPPDFLMKSVGYFADPQVAYVQARNESRPESLFQTLLGDGIRVFYNRVLRFRAKYGVVMNYGHGVLIRRAAWAAIGGYPEGDNVLSEDLHFALNAYEAGYHGIYNPQVVCFERFPVDYAALRGRTERWERGTAQVFRRALRTLRSPRMRTEQKLDILVDSFRPYTTFLLLAFIGLSLASVLTGTLAFPPITWPLLVFALLASLLPAVRELGWRRAMLAWGLSAFVFNGLLFVSARGLLKRGVRWHVTPRSQARLSVRSAVRQTWLELLCGSVLLALTVWSSLYILLTLAVPWITTVFLLRSRLLSTTSWVPGATGSSVTLSAFVRALLPDFLSAPTLSWVRAQTPTMIHGGGGMWGTLPGKVRFLSVLMTAFIILVILLSLPWPTILARPVPAE